MVETQEAGLRLDCPVCWTPYDNGFHTPKLLQCGHSFCVECLARLSLAAATIRDQLACPLCRHPTLLLPGRPVTELPADAAVLGLLGLQPRRVALEGRRLSLREPRPSWGFLRRPRVRTLDLGPETEDDAGPGSRPEAPMPATGQPGCAAPRDCARHPQLRLFVYLTAVIVSLALLLFFLSFWTKQFFGG